MFRQSCGSGTADRAELSMVKVIVKVLAVEPVYLLIEFKSKLGATGCRQREEARPTRSEALMVQPPTAPIKITAPAAAFCPGHRRRQRRTKSCHRKGSRLVLQ